MNVTRSTLLSLLSASLLFLVPPLLHAETLSNDSAAVNAPTDVVENICGTNVSIKVELTIFRPTGECCHHQAHSTHQASFQRHRQGGFPRGGKIGQPHHSTTVTELVIARVLTDTVLNSGQFGRFGRFGT